MQARKPSNLTPSLIWIVHRSYILVYDKTLEFSTPEKLMYTLVFVALFFQSKLKSWKAQALWNKFDKRASHKCYNRGKACSNNRVSPNHISTFIEQLKRRNVLLNGKTFRSTCPTKWSIAILTSLMS